MEHDFCGNNCGCGMEHGCICGMCDMTPEEIADMVKFYEELGEVE